MAGQNPILPLTGELLAGESSRAVQACNDYLRLGAGRTLAFLARRYREAPQNQPKPTKIHQESAELPPTRSLNTIQKWAQRFDWPGRASEYDARLEELKNAEARKRFKKAWGITFDPAGEDLEG